MKKLGIGIIGAGWVSKWHIKGYQSLKDKVEILAIADINKEKVKAVAKENEIKYALTDHHKLLGMKEIEAVSITVPTFLHKKIAIEAAKFKKNILCEKPLAMNVKECEEMLKAAKQNKVLLMPGHNRLFFPPHLKMKELVEEGKIGEPKMFQGEFLEDLPSSEIIEFGKDWRFKRREGKGAVLESAIHEIYLVEKLMGKIESVMAHLTSFNQKKAQVETTTQISLKTKKGGLGSITLSWEVPFYEDMELLIGEKGVILLSGVEWPRFHHPFLGIYSKPKKTWEFLDVSFDWSESFLGIIKHFIDCVETGEEPSVTAIEGRNAIAVVDAIYESEKKGTRVRVK